MVSLDRWDETDIKIKIFLKGFSGTGKTRLCVKMAGIMAKKGYNVLYLDGENGADRELKILKKELTPEENSRIEKEDFENFKQMFDHIKFHVKNKGDKLKLIIIDTMKLTELARLSARDIFLNAGSYPWGSGMREIKNKDAFDVFGYLYGTSNRMELEFTNYLVTCKQDIICTLRLLPDTKDYEFKYKNTYDGIFDYVYETIVERGSKNLNFKAYPSKKRGTSSTDTEMIDDLIGEIVGIFREKYAKNDVISVIPEPVAIENNVKTISTKEDSKIENDDGKNVSNS
jgi:hypothetical protein